MRNRFTAICCLAALSSTPVMAGTNTATFTVNMTVLKQCTINAPQNMNLGSFTAAQLTNAIPPITAPYIVICSANTAYSIAFASPNDTSNGVHQMVGTNTGKFIPYNLVDVTSNSSSTTPISSSNPVSGTGVGSAQVFQLEALVSNYSTVPADVYTDTVTMTITY